MLCSNFVAVGNLCIGEAPIKERFKGSLSGSSSEKIPSEPALQAEAKDEFEPPDPVSGGDAEAAASVEEVNDIFTIELLDDNELTEVCNVVVFVEVL